MASGGIYDHLGGGFARYSVDQMWLVPHFEKMLYDQALLARVYLHAWQLTGEPRFLQVLTETIGYVAARPASRRRRLLFRRGRRLRGRRREVLRLDLRAAAARSSAPMPTPQRRYWDVHRGGNFEGATILNRMHARGQFARDDVIEGLRRRLFEARERRVRPGLDDKVLTEWNALDVRHARRSRRRDRAIERGSTRQSPTPSSCWPTSGAPMVGGFGRGSRTTADGPDISPTPPTTRRWSMRSPVWRRRPVEARWIDSAQATADELIDLFWDDDGGRLLHDRSRRRAAGRTMPRICWTTPRRRPTARPRWPCSGWLRSRVSTATATMPQRSSSCLGDVAKQHPTAVAHLLAAVELWHAGATEIAVVGDAADLVHVAQAAFLPNAVLAWGEPYPSPLWQSRQPGHAYVCRDFVCQAPVTTKEALAAQLVTAPGTQVPSA